MHKKLPFLLLISASVFSQQLDVTFDIDPEPFSEDQLITITASDFNPAVWGVSDVYLWAWSSANGVEADAPNNGAWTDSNEAHKLTNNGDGTYSISFIPKDFYARTDLETI